MSSEPAQSVQVRVEEQGARSRLLIPASAPPHEVDPQAILALCRERNLVLDAVMEQRVRTSAEAFHADGETIDIVLSEAVPAEHGTPGGLEWEPGFDPTAVGLDLDSDESGAVDHYNAVERTCADKGAHVATLVEPTPGSDGCDVTGRVLSAEPGRAAPVTIDEASIETRDGQLYARCSGLVEFTDGVVRISPVLEIPEHVDFSTGNIDFRGSVHVGGNVSDLFVVRASDGVRVEGLVGAATILCGGDFVCRRGMAAKDRGQIMVEGNVQAGYLNNVRGRVRGDVQVRGELMDCELVIGGALRGRRAAVVGGVLAVTGAVELSMLGSGGGAPTTLILGEVPIVAAKLFRLERLRQRYRAILDSQAPVEGGLSLIEIRSRHDQCEEKRRELLSRIERARSVSLSVQRTIHPRVKLRIMNDEFTFLDGVKGPIRIGLDRRGDVVFQRGRQDEPHPLFDIAKRAA